MTTKTVAIIASGPSIKTVDLSAIKADRIIAVNAAITYEGLRATDWFSLDPSSSNKRLAGAAPDVSYWAAGFPMMPNTHHLTRVSSQGIEPDDKHSPEWWFWRWSCVPGLSESIGSVHTGNSAYGALNLAYHWRPEKIAFFGLDGTNEAKPDGTVPNNLSHLPILFASSLPQLQAAGIQVVNGSPNSMVDCFPRMTPQEAIEWLA